MAENRIECYFDYCAGLRVVASRTAQSILPKHGGTSMYYRIETEFTGELRPKWENPLPLPSDWTALLAHARIFDDVRVQARMKDEQNLEYVVGEIAQPAIADGEKLTVAIAPGTPASLLALGFQVRADRYLVAYFDSPVRLSSQTWTRLLFQSPESSRAAEITSSWRPPQHTLKTLT